jgi:predicted nucleotidyltransferase
MDKKFLNNSEYNFLREDEHLGKNIGMLYLGGSISYGTNLPGKGDIDLRGFAFEKPSDLIGYTDFTEIVETETDTTIYAFNKFVSLLEKCNPNTIEALGCKEDHYFYLTDVGRELTDNAEMFLSQIAFNSFGGYASQQLSRLENALSLNSLDSKKKLEHLLRSLECSVRSFAERYKFIDYDFTNFYHKKMPIHGPNGMSLYIGETDKNVGEEVLIDLKVEGYPVRDLNAIFSEFGNISRTYSKLNQRNKKKDEEHLDKHAMHLIRLYYMAFDILENHQVITYREKEREELLAIRQGYYRNEDGSYKKAFFDYRDSLEKRLNSAFKKTTLPERPDRNKIQDFVMKVNKRIINGDL